MTNNKKDEDKMNKNRQKSCSNDRNRNYMGEIRWVRLTNEYDESVIA